LGQPEFSALVLYELRYSEGLSVPLGLEAGETSIISEEPIVCHVQVPESRLQGLGIDLFHPDKSRVFLNLGQDFGIVVVVQGFLGLKVCLLSLVKEVVEYEPLGTKVFCKQDCLLFGG